MRVKPSFRKTDRTNKPTSPVNIFDTFFNSSIFCYKQVCCNYEKIHIQLQVKYKFYDDECCWILTFKFFRYIWRLCKNIPIIAFLKTKQNYFAYYGSLISLKFKMVGIMSDVHFSLYTACQEGLSPLTFIKSGSTS